MHCVTSCSLGRAITTQLTLSLDKANITFLTLSQLYMKNGFLLRIYLHRDKTQITVIA
jgi:hypothetical protein